jgi:uncharacterized protein
MLENLITLHRVDLRIKENQRHCSEIPKKIEEVNRLLQAARKKVDDLKNDIKENEKIVRRNEQKIEDNRQQQGKYRAQLYKLKSNREYTTLNAEIKALDGNTSELETEILELMESNDNKRERLIIQEKSLKEEEIRIKDVARDFEKELQEEREKLVREEQIKTSLVATLTEESLAQYNKVMRKHGSSVAEIIMGSCGGCNVKVRPQIAALARANDQLISCEGCGRFLFWSEESE